MTDSNVKDVDFSWKYVAWLKVWTYIDALNDEDIITENTKHRIQEELLTIKPD